MNKFLLVSALSYSSIVAYNFYNYRKLNKIIEKFALSEGNKCNFNDENCLTEKIKNSKEGIFVIKNNNIRLAYVRFDNNDYKFTDNDIEFDYLISIAHNYIYGEEWYIPFPLLFLLKSKICTFNVNCGKTELNFLIKSQ